MPIGTLKTGFSSQCCRCLYTFTHGASWTDAWGEDYIPYTFPGNPATGDPTETIKVNFRQTVVTLTIRCIRNPVEGHCCNKFFPSDNPLTGLLQTETFALFYESGSGEGPWIFRRPVREAVAGQVNYGAALHFRRLTIDGVNTTIVSHFTVSADLDGDGAVFSGDWDIIDGWANSAGQSQIEPNSKTCDGCLVSFSVGQQYCSRAWPEDTPPTIVVRLNQYMPDVAPCTLGGAPVDITLATLGSLDTIDGYTIMPLTTMSGVSGTKTVTLNSEITSALGSSPPYGVPGQAAVSKAAPCPWNTGILTYYGTVGFQFAGSENLGSGRARSPLDPYTLSDWTGTIAEMVEDTPG